MLLLFLGETGEGAGQLMSWHMGAMEQFSGLEAHELQNDGLLTQHEVLALQMCRIWKKKPQQQAGLFAGIRQSSRDPYIFWALGAATAASAVDCAEFAASQKAWASLRPAT